ncbi:MAG TPA: hypothetical protein VHZ51_17555, partial [Ktedonobacteraceae bacterium]|nr:hypothetical protein [Ktedonobacteraceae bacterium]
HSQSPVRRTKHAIGHVLLVLAILLATPLVGIGATLAILYSQDQFPPHTALTATHPLSLIAAPTPTQAAASTTNQLPVPTAFKQTSSTDLNVSLKYPADWDAATPQKNSDSDSITQDISSQNLGIVFSIIRFSSSITSQAHNASDINQSYFAALGGTHDVQNLQNAATTDQRPTIAGTQWTEANRTFTDSNGDQIHTTIITVEHHNVYYAIRTLLPETYYHEATQKYFQPMLDSFQFLS